MVYLCLMQMCPTSTLSQRCYRLWSLRFCCCGFWDPKQDPGWILQVQPALPTLGALGRQKLYPSSCCTGRALWGQRACRSEVQKHSLGWALGKLETGLHTFPGASGLLSRPRYFAIDFDFLSFGTRTQVAVYNLELTANVLSTSSPSSATFTKHVKMTYRRMGKVQMLSPRSKVRNIRQKNLNLEKQETSKPSHLSLGCKQKTYEDD
nr:uncharacterized protein LOC110365699 isoform X1 [Columba livia]